MVKYYAVRHKDRNILKKSRSGGFFTLISDFVLERNGVVYACKLNEELKVIHTRAATKQERDNCRGSKYVQSEIGKTFIEAKNDLDKGLMVLFSGTSCQVNAFLRYLGKRYSKLITVDILCHAVPSPKVYEEFKSFFKDKYAEDVTSVNFRDKEYGWGADVMTLQSEHHRMATQSFYDFFWAHYSIRPSCFNCKYKKIDRGDVDFTVADFWGINRVAPEYSDDRGISMVICNSELSNEIFSSLLHLMQYKEVEVNEVLLPCLKGNFEICERRSSFFADLRKVSLDVMISNYGSKHRHYRLMKQQIKRVIYKLLNK